MKLKDKTLSANTGLDAIKRAPIVEYDTGLKCIRIQDISQGKNYDEWGFTETNEKDRKKFLLKKNDLLIARTGATVGVSQFIKEDTEAVYNNRTIRLRLEKSLNPRFVYYIFQTKGFLQYIDNISCVATQPNLRIEGLLRFTIPDYSIEKQNAIVKTLSTFDDLIENNNKRIKLLKQMAENLYKEWFVRFRFPGYEDVEFENGIPNGWAVEKVKKCVNRLPFNQLYKQNDLENEGSVIVIDQSSTDFLGFHNNEPSHYASIEKPIILFGDHSCKFVLMVRDFSLGENVVPFISFDDNFLDNYYLYYAVHKLIATEEYKRHWGRFTAMKIFIPQYHLQKTFSDIVKPMLEEKQKLWNENQLLIKQRDMLLPRLMSGKLEV